MKKLSFIKINSEIEDAIIEFWNEPLRDKEGQFIWTDKENYIGKVRPVGREVIVYFRDDDGLHRIEINATSIKALAKELMELEQNITEEFIEP
jgi:hypothetical protein